MGSSSRNEPLKRWSGSLRIHGHRGRSNSRPTGLKAGGALIVVDHVAAPGSSLATTESLHRIDPAIMRREIEAAGFVFDSGSNVLANPDDDHSRSVFDPSIRGAADQVVLKFHEPQ
jgi:predicted methyltransferase